MVLLVSLSLPPKCQAKTIVEIYSDEEKVLLAVTKISAAKSGLVRARQSVSVRTESRGITSVEAVLIHSHTFTLSNFPSYLPTYQCRLSFFSRKSWPFSRGTGGMMAHGQILNITILGRFLSHK